MASKVSSETREDLSTAYSHTSRTDLVVQPSESHVTVTHPTRSSLWPHLTYRSNTWFCLYLMVLYRVSPLKGGFTFVTFLQTKIECHLLITKVQAICKSVPWFPRYQPKSVCKASAVSESAIVQTNCCYHTIHYHNNCCCSKLRFIFCDAATWILVLKNDCVSLC